MKRAPFLLLIALLGACSPHAPSGSVSADEASQLNDAAAMLDANSVDANAVDPDSNESDAQ